MTSGGWFLVFAIFVSTVCFASSLSIRRPVHALIIPIFVFGVLTSELAWFFAPLQALVSLVFVGSGALDHAAGQVAMLLMFISLFGLWRLHRQSNAADEVFRRAMTAGLGESYREQIPGDRLGALAIDIDRSQWMRPFSMSRPGVDRYENLSYGDAGVRNLLDIYRPQEPRPGGFPVLLQVHGGGWIMGQKQQQALPLLYHMAQRGWLCVDVNYRLSPADAFPAHIIDIKKAIAWIREHAGEYGGNPDFIAISGGSAGGHLTALAALSANDPAFQPGFENVDTHLDVAVPMYGVYDFLDSDGENLNSAVRDMLEEQVMQSSPLVRVDEWNAASPVAREHSNAPPFLVVHGSNDVMTSCESARNFATRLAANSRQPTVYAELPGGQHAFDCMHSIRTAYLLNHVGAFLEWVHANCDKLSSEADAVATSPAD